MYGSDEKNSRYRNIDKKLAKKFWTTFVEKLLRNKCICENLHCFAHFRGYVKMENFKCEKMIISTPYLISEHFKIISNHRKKLMDFWTRGTNRNPPEKKLAGIFGKFF